MEPATEVTMTTFLMAAQARRMPGLWRGSNFRQWRKPVVWPLTQTPPVPAEARTSCPSALSDRIEQRPLIVPVQRQRRPGERPQRDRAGLAPLQNLLSQIRS